MRRGVAPERVLLESWSLDTIGNAAFARLMHADLAQARSSPRDRREVRSYLRAGRWAEIVPRYRRGPADGPHLAQWRRMLVVTSDFHLPRTRAMFELVPLLQQ